MLRVQVCLPIGACVFKARLVPGKRSRASTLGDLEVCISREDPRGGFINGGNFPEIT